MRRCLQCDDGVVTAPAATKSAAAKPKEAELRKAFSTSLLVSAVRCLVTYLVLPFAAPALGFAKGVGPGISITLGLVAIFFNVLSIRRFWAADHRWKWAYSAISGTVIAMLCVMIATDIAELVS